MTVRRGSASYVSYMLTGAAGWVLATALLHWLPVPLRLDPQFTPRAAALMAADGAVFATAIYLLMRRVPAAERLSACAALIMPGLLGDAAGMAFFGDFFPNINADGSNLLAALLLLTYAVIVATGWLMAVCPTHGRRIR